MQTDATNYSKEFLEALNNRIVKTSGTMRKSLVCLNLECSPTSLRQMSKNKPANKPKTKHSLNSQTCQYLSPVKIWARERVLALEAPAFSNVRLHFKSKSDD